MRVAHQGLPLSPEAKIGGWSNRGELVTKTSTQGLGAPP